MYLSLILAILVAILAFPLGMFVEKFTREEVKQGKKYLKAIFLLSIVGFGMSVLFKQIFLEFSFVFFALFVQGGLWMSRRH